MSTLSSTSTLAEIKASYADNASYEEDVSVAKAKGFVTACRLLLMKLPRATGTGSSNLELDLQRIENELRAAQAWLASAGGGTAGSRVKYGSFAGYRG